jgi:hypothetical protein
LLVVLLLGTALGQDNKATDKSESKPKTSEKKKATKEPVPSYSLRKLEGFQVLVSDETIKFFDDPMPELSPKDVLILELQEVAKVMPPKLLRILQTVLIWVEWDNRIDAKALGSNGIVLARYFGGSALGLAQQGGDPRKANTVEVVTMKRITEIRQPSRNAQKCTILHELAHVVHHRFLNWDNPGIKTSFQQAVDRGLYQNVKHVSGREMKAYAATSDAEYFAELSCAYLDKCDYFPFGRDDLKSYDAVGYKLMEQVWGTPDSLEAARKKGKPRTTASAKPKSTSGGSPKEANPTENKPLDPEKVAATKLELIQSLMKTSKTVSIREKLQDLIKSYPDTKAATQAKKLLETVKD